MEELTLSYDHGDILNKRSIPRDPSKKTGCLVWTPLKLFEVTIAGLVVISVVARYCKVLLNSWQLLNPVDKIDSREGRSIRISAEMRDAHSNWPKPPADIEEPKPL